MYNYFGVTAFQQIVAGYRAVGVLKNLNYDCIVFPELFAHGLDNGIPPHPHIRKLVKHSEYVKFIVGARNIFLNEFQDYKSEDFKGMDGEALFAGTVVHSLEHAGYGRGIEDILWLDHNHSDFGFMADATQFVLSGFVDDLPLLPFNRRFKNATHPFYKAVYEGARQLNPWLADSMDTCIIK